MRGGIDRKGEPQYEASGIFHLLKYMPFWSRRCHLQQLRGMQSPKLRVKGPAYMSHTRFALITFTSVLRTSF